jgi:hypothetical protein
VDSIATTGTIGVISTLTAEGSDRRPFRVGWRGSLRSGKTEAADPMAETSHDPARLGSRFTASRNENGTETAPPSGGTARRHERQSATAGIDIACGIQNSKLSPR